MRLTVDLGEIKNECFELMPFGPKFDPIYEEVLQPAIEEVGLTPTRADLIYGSRRTMQDIWINIRASRMVVAELIGRNMSLDLPTHWVSRLSLLQTAWRMSLST